MSSTCIAIQQENYYDNMSGNYGVKAFNKNMRAYANCWLDFIQYFVMTVIFTNISALNECKKALLKQSAYESPLFQRILQRYLLNSNSPGSRGTVRHSDLPSQW